MYIRNAVKRLKQEGFTISHANKLGVCYASIVYATKQDHAKYIHFNVSSGGFGRDAIAYNFRVLGFDCKNREDWLKSAKSFKNISQAINYVLDSNLEKMRELS